MLSTFKHIVLIHQDVKVVVIFGTLLTVHLQVFQTLAGFLESGCSGVLPDVSGLQVFQPFLKGRCGQFVELVHAYDIVFREHLLGGLHSQGFLVALTYAKVVAGMHTRQLRLTVVQIVRTLTQVEVDDVDGVNLLHVPVALSA